MLPTFDELYARLLASDETVQIEAKASSELGEATLKTVCAYANEPGLGGGYLLLGVSGVRTAEGVEYSITGLRDADAIQADLANQCLNCFNEPVRPQMVVHVTDKKKVIAVYIPESQASDKPVFIKKVGLPKGAFRRIGSADCKFTDADMALFYQLRSQKSYDADVLSGASMADISAEAIKEYKRIREEKDPTASELKLTPPRMLQSLGLAIESKDGLQITRAGLLLFGKKASLSRLMPAARVDYLLMPGKEWVSDPKQRYRAVEVTSALILTVPKIVELVTQDLPKAVQLKGRRLRRKEIPAVPYAVIREAIVNAVMHREYRVHEPIQIIKFSNRLEIKNGGYSLKSNESLGKPGSVTRNQMLAKVLHETGYAETKGTGIITMRQQMHAANLTEPIFKSDRDEDSFSVTLFTHHLLDEETIAWLKSLELELSEDDTRALVIAREMGYIDNSIYRAATTCDTLSASKRLKKLAELGVLKAHHKGSATFYTFTDSPRTPSTSSKDKRPLSSESDTKDSVLGLPPDLFPLLKKLGERADPRLVELAILKLCSVRPFSSAELANFVQRHQVYVLNFTRRLIAEGSLVYLYPGSGRHPRQKYVTAPLFRDLELPADVQAQLRPRKRKKDPYTPKFSFE